MLESSPSPALTLRVGLTCRCISGRPPSKFDNPSRKARGASPGLSLFQLAAISEPKKKKPDDRMLAHTHSQISSPPCIHHSFSPWALYSLSSTLGCQGGRLVRSDKGRICLCPLVPTEHMLSNVHAILARHQSRLPLGPTSFGRQTQKLARPTTVERGGLSHKPYWKWNHERH